MGWVCVKILDGEETLESAGPRLPSLGVPRKEREREEIGLKEGTTQHTTRGGRHTAEQEVEERLRERKGLLTGRHPLCVNKESDCSQV